MRTSSYAVRRKIRGLRSLTGAEVSRDECPLFASTCCGVGVNETANATTSEDTSKLLSETECIFAIGGGGGSTKTGVPNKLSLWKANLRSPFELIEVDNVDTLPSAVNCICADKKNENILCGLEDEIVVFEIKNGGKIGFNGTSPLKLDKKGSVRCITFADDGLSFYCGCEDGSLVGFSYPDLMKHREFVPGGNAKEANSISRVLFSSLCSSETKAVTKLQILIAMSSEEILFLKPDDFSQFGAIRTGDIGNALTSGRFSSNKRAGKAVFRGIEVIDEFHAAILVSQFRGRGYIAIYRMSVKDSTATTADIELQTVQQILDHPCTSLSSDGCGRLFVGSNKGNIVLVDVTNPRRPQVITRHRLAMTFPVTSISLPMEGDNCRGRIAAITGIDGVFSVLSIERANWISGWPLWILLVISIVILAYIMQSVHLE